MNIPLRQYWEVLAPHLRWQWRKVALLALLLLATTALQLVNPQLLRRFIDTALAAGAAGASAETEGAATGVLATTALLFLLAGLANQLLSALATYVGNDVGWLATNRLRADLAMHCLRLDMGFHNARTPGELIERIDGDVTALANFFSAFVIRVLGSVLLMVGVLVMLAREDARVGLVLAVFALVVFFALNRSRALAVPAAAAEREASARLFGFLEERLSGIDDVRASGAGGYVMRRFSERMAELFHRGRRAWMLRALMWAITMGLFGLGNALALAMGARLFQLGAITLGTVYLFFQYIELLLGPLERLTNQLQDLQQASAGIARVQELYRIRHTVLDGPGATLPPGPLAVEFDGVSFHYPDVVAEGVAPAHGVAQAGVTQSGVTQSGVRRGGKDGPLAPPDGAPSDGAPSEAHLDTVLESDAVLQDVSFRLEPGHVLGLLGRTGSGKTTIARLLFRLYDPTAGAVRLSGVDLRRLHLAHLRARVTMVTQDVQLFRGTVRENLTLFDDAVSDAQVLRVLEELGLTEWQRALPDGLDTALGPGGHGLSAGEAQLLAFTRAFLGDPSLVILDEASSRLDLATEQLIERAVGRLLRGRTGVIIAHRLATVQRADEIVILQDGRVREYGRRAALAEDPHSRFAALMRAGMEAGADGERHEPQELLV